MTADAFQRRPSHMRIKPLRSEDERRTEPRVAVRLHTELLDLEGEAMASGVTEDAGRRGLFVRSDFLEPPGTEVRLSVGLDDEELTLHGEVAWVTEDGDGGGPGMGIRLRDSAESRRLGEHLFAEAS